MYVSSFFLGCLAVLVATSITISNGRNGGTGIDVGDHYNSNSVGGVGGGGIVVSASKSVYSVACSSPCVPGDESIMAPKAHGTSETPVQSNLRWGCEFKLADRICNFNRRYAERSGYFQTTSFLDEMSRLNDNAKTTSNEDSIAPMNFYDSNTGALLFQAPVGRSVSHFLSESRHHGWPSFRDEEVNWNNVRVLSNGETVSIHGTHLGHNLPDRHGNRYCINLVSIAGNAMDEDE